MDGLMEWKSFFKHITHLSSDVDVPDNCLNSTRCFYHIVESEDPKYNKCFIGPFSRTARPKVADGSKGTNRISKRDSVLKVRGGCYNYRFKAYK